MKYTYKAGSQKFGFFIIYETFVETQMAAIRKFNGSDFWNPTENTAI